MQASEVPTVCYENILAKYSWDWHTMAAIERAESNCNPNAIGRVDYDGIRDFGLLQIHGSPIFNPSDNIAAAYQIWLRQGYGAWTSYNTGFYLTYLQ